MIGHGYILRIVLGAPFESQKIVIAASFGIGKIAADFGARFINRATAFLGVKEPANLAEMLVGLAAHCVLAAVFLACKRLFGGLKVHVVMFGKALNITLLQGNQGIGTAVARAF